MLDVKRSFLFQKISGIGRSAARVSTPNVNPSTPKHQKEGRFAARDDRMDL